MQKIDIHIEGMTCLGCVNSVETVLYKVDGVKQVDIDLEKNSGVITAEDHVSFDAISNAVSSAGNYSASKKDATKTFTGESFESNESYKPLVIVVLYLLGVTLTMEFASGMFLWETWMPNFMAGFFLIFSFFKMLDIKSFANAYAMYDLIAMRSKAYALTFPFIELGLGFAYILIPDLALTHLVTAIVMFVSLLGVVKAVTDKRKIQCACLGTGFNLPMSTVTIIEDGVMLIMAVIMYLNAI